MTAEQVGGYMLLLCCQWEQGSVPPDDASLKRIARCSQSALAAIKVKFIVCEDGQLRNERMENIRRERDEFCKAQGRKANKRWKNRGSPPAMPGHQSGNAVALPGQYQNDALLSSSSSSSSMTDRQTSGEPKNDRSELTKRFTRLLNKPESQINWGPIVNWLATVEADGLNELAAKCLDHALQTSNSVPQTAQGAVKYVTAIYERCRQHECEPGEFDPGDKPSPTAAKAKAVLDEIFNGSGK